MFDWIETFRNSVRDIKIHLLLLTKQYINTIIEYKAICKIIKHKINEG